MLVKRVRSADGFTTKFHQPQQGTALRIVRSPRFQLIVVVANKLKEELRVAGVVLGTTRTQSLPVILQRLGVDAKHMHQIETQQEIDYRPLLCSIAMPTLLPGIGGAV